MKRFITEYAEWQINYYRELRQKYPQTTDNVAHAEKVINRAVKLCDKGIITIDECMSIINRPLEVGVIG